jgi:RsiW-degrading membrane proteinase PrsW (M82 family)
VTFSGSNSGSGAAAPGVWAFNPPPGWPPPPPGWQPPAGWQPDPSWPAPPAGWNFWVPAQAPGTPYGYTSPNIPAAPHNQAPFGFPGQSGFGGAQAAPHPDALKTVLGTLFPVRNWVHDRGWRQWTRLIIIPYALLPLIYLILFTNSVDPSTPGWAYSLYVAPLWAGGFWLLIRPGALRKRELWIALAVIAWVIVWIYAVTQPVEAALAGAQKINIPSAIVVGIAEELNKALPILVIGLILKKRGIQLDVRMWMFMGTVAGLAFGVIEASTVYAAVNTQAAVGGVDQLIGDVVQLVQAQGKLTAGQTQQVNAAAANIDIQFILSFAERVFLDGLQHALWAGISGFFMGIAVNYRKRRVAIVALGLAVPALLHALNDFTVGGTFNGDLPLWIWVIIQGVSVVLFLSYTLSAHSIEEHIRDNPFFRGQSMIMPIIRPNADQATPAQQAGAVKPTTVRPTPMQPAGGHPGTTPPGPGQPGPYQPGPYQTGPRAPGAPGAPGQPPGPPGPGYPQPGPYQPGPYQPGR